MESCKYVWKFQSSSYKKSSSPFEVLHEVFKSCLFLIICFPLRLPPPSFSLFLAILSFAFLFRGWMVNGLFSIEILIEGVKIRFCASLRLICFRMFFHFCYWLSVSVTIRSFLLVVVLQPLISFISRFWTCFSWWFAIAWAARRFTDDESRASSQNILDFVSQCCLFV